MVDAASRTIKAKKQPRSLCLEGRYGSLRRRVPGCVSACESETLCILVYLFTVFVYNHQSPISREVSANTFIFTVLWVNAGFTRTIVDRYMSKEDADLPGPPQAVLPKTKPRTGGNEARISTAVGAPTGTGTVPVANSHLCRTSAAPARARKMVRSRRDHAASATLPILTCPSSATLAAGLGLGLPE